MSREIEMSVRVVYSEQPNPLPPFASEYPKTESARKMALDQAENRVKLAMRTALANLFLPIQIEEISVEFYKPASLIRIAR